MKRRRGGRRENGDEDGNENEDDDKLELVNINRAGDLSVRDTPFL